MCALVKYRLKVQMILFSSTDSSFSPYRATGTDIHTVSLLDAPEKILLLHLPSSPPSLLPPVPLVLLFLAVLGIEPSAFTLDYMLALLLLFFNLGTGSH